MNIIKKQGFVIEGRIPISMKEITEYEKAGATTHYDTLVDNGVFTHLHYQWWGGKSVLPGSGRLGPGGFIPLTPVDFWSPYFEDANIFDSMEEAYECMNKFLPEESGYSVVSIHDAKIKYSWSYNR